MTASPVPRFLLCARCSHSALADDAPGWGAVQIAVGSEQRESVDVCDECMLTILEFLRSTP
jgi:hypothetical protein